MSQVIIPFKCEWHDKMINGVKVCTSRTKAYGQAGDTFTWFNHVFQITAVEAHKLDYVAKRLFKQEGCESPSEFIRVWEGIHSRKGFIPSQTIYVHFFKLLGELGYADKEIAKPTLPEQFR